MNHRTSILSRRHLKAYVAAFISYVILAGQLAPLTLAAAPKPRARAAAESSAESSAPAPAAPHRAAPLAAPMPVFAPSITATKVDAWDDSVIPNGKAEPGQTITYTVTINNTGPDPATGVVFTDNVDTNTSLVSGSVQTQPIATGETLTAFGNVRISTANGAPNLLDNDCDPDDTTPPCNSNLTASGPTAAPTNGQAVVNSDGTFSYNPNPGYTGSDSFTYTVRDTGPDNIAGNSDDKTDTATVNITVGPTTIWFINNTAASGGDGRITSPFNSIAAYNGSAPTKDPGDIIFLYTGTGTYTGGFALANTQKVIGQGFALATETGTAPTGSDPLPGAGSAPTIDNVGANVITLAQNNTLRGFNTGNTGAAGTDISGTTFGTLTVSNLSINGDGRALNLTTGTLAATVANLSASNTGSLDGLTLNGVGGALTVSGTTSITNPGGDGIDISNAPAGVSFSFGTATVSKNAAGACLTLATNNASATTSFASLTVTNSSGAGITTNNGGTLNVTTGSITTTGTGVAGSFTNTGLGVTFTSVSSNGGANGLIFSGGSGTFTSGTTNLQNNGGIGLSVSGSAVVAGFGNTTVSSSAGDAVDLATNSGNITFADLDMTPDAGLRGLDAQNNTGTITVTSGDVTTSGAGASAVFVDGPTGRTPINLTFTSVTTAGVGSGSASISLTEVSGTKFQVTGTTQVNTRSGTGVLVNNSTATTIQFATVNVPNPNNAGGYGIRVESSSSAVTVSSATIDNASVATAQTDAGDGTPGNDGDGDAIFLKSNTGAFTLNGGTLSNCGNDCLDLRDSTALTVSGVTVQSPGIDTAGTGTGQGGNGFQLINLTGTSSITGTTISPFTAAGHAGIYFFNKGGGTSTTTVQGVTFSGFTGNGSVGIQVLTQNASTTNFTIGGPTNNVATNCTFTNVNGSAINFSTTGTATLNATLQRSTFQNAATDAKTNVTGGHIGTSHVSYNILNNTFTNVMKVASTGEGLLSFSADGTVAGNTFAMNMTGNTISGVGLSTNICGGGASNCLGPLDTILIFIDNNSNVPGTIVVDGNSVTNTQQGAMKLDMNNTGAQAGTKVDAKIINNTFGTAGSPVGANPGATSSYGVRVERRINNGIPANVLISGNTINNGPGSGSLLNGPGIHARTKANDNMSVTITNNTINTSGAANEIRLDTNENEGQPVVNPTMCADVSGNTLAGGAAGVIALHEINGTLNIEQASSVALSAANGGATVSVNAGTPSFGVACATPPAAPEIETFDSGLGQNIGAPTSATADAATRGVAGTNVTASRPTVAPRATTAPKVAAPKAVKVEAKRDAGTTFRYAAADTSAPLNSAAEVSPAPAPEPAPEPLAQQRRKVSAPVLTDDPGPNGSGGIVSVNIGTLAPGDSVTITFQVVIDNPYSGGPNVSNQGTVSSSTASFSNVLTDDPDSVGANNPTLTPVNAIDIRINDAKVAEPASPNTIDMVFTVALSQPAGGPISINFQTADGTATAGTCGNPGADYVSTTGTVNFSAGQQVMTINVPVCSDAVAEGDETFTVTLSSPSAGTLADAMATGTITTNTPGTFLISELRTSGPGGTGDDFVEFYNNSNSPLTIAASDASAGYGIYKMGATCSDTPVLIGTIPNGTIVPARGHYLLVGSQYSLVNYGGTSAAAGNLTMSSDVETDRNVGVFSTSNVVNISSLNRLDAVGFGTNTGAVCDLLREPSNLGAIAAAPTIEHTFFRNMGQAVGGNPKDTNDNSADFLFADTQGTFISGIPQRLGAPGPENLASPIRRDTSGVGLVMLDGSVATSAPPNRVRDFTADAPNNSPFGTLSIRRRVTNSTGGNVTRLRFRIVEMTTFPSPGGGVADLRARTTPTSVVISGINDPGTCASTGTPATAPCQVTVQPTTLEQPPTQPYGGGYNSTLSAGTITMGMPLANGASLNVNFLLGIQQTGNFRFLIIVEALP